MTCLDCHLNARELQHLKDDISQLTTDYMFWEIILESFKKARIICICDEQNAQQQKINLWQTQL